MKLSLLRPYAAPLLVFATLLSTGSLGVVAASSRVPRDVGSVFGVLNSARGSQRVRPLRLDPRLSEIARRYAADMAARRYFGHMTPEGLTPFARMTQARYRYGYAGENVGRGRTALQAQKWLWNDRPHRAVMLNPHFARVGIGTARTANEVILVEDFSD
jgi:uncharacterized protein YkwD